MITLKKKLHRHPWDYQPSVNENHLKQPKHVTSSALTERVITDGPKIQIRRPKTNNGLNSIVYRHGAAKAKSSSRSNMTKTVFSDIAGTYNKYNNLSKTNSYL